MTPTQIDALARLKNSGTKLQKDQQEKLESKMELQRALIALRRQHPAVFHALTDRVPKYTVADTDSFDLAIYATQSAVQTAWLWPSAHTDDMDASFHLPLSEHERRTTKVLLSWHHFDVNAAKAAASLAARCPSVLLSKHMLFQSFGRIMQQVQPQHARELTNMLVTHLQPDYLHRLVDAPLPPDVKFKLAASELHKHEPCIAEMLNFRLHGLSRVATRKQPATAACKGDRHDALSEALNHPHVRCMAAAGEFMQLPAWLQRLPCTSAVNEADSIHVTCPAPTKVYMLCLSLKSHPPSLLNIPRYATDTHAAWKLEASAKLFARYDNIHQSDAWAQGTLQDPKPRFLKSKSVDSCLVCSMVLQPGVYTLNTNDAIYFFDMHRHTQQQRLQASRAPLCKFMQRNGDCDAGDCCKYSHAPPRYFSPEVSVYTGCMLLQCKSNLRSSLRLSNTDQMPSHTRARLYSKHNNQHGGFHARRRVLSAGIMATLLLRLVYPSGTRCKARALAATQQLPLHVYGGLMRSDFDDGDASTYVDHLGFRYRTLFKHKHSRQSHQLDSGAVFYSGGAQTSECGRAELPEGWEVCPPDDASIAVCMQYTWQSTSLVLSDSQAYATLGCPCDACHCSRRSASQTPRKLHISPSNARFNGRWVTIDGSDVLVRRWRGPF